VSEFPSCVLEKKSAVDDNDDCKHVYKQHSEKDENRGSVLVEQNGFIHLEHALLPEGFYLRVRLVVCQRYATPGGSRFRSTLGCPAGNNSARTPLTYKEASRRGKVRKKFGRHEGAFTVPSTSKVTEWHASDSHFRQNNSGAARSIPGHTKQRILAAAKELNYCPNYSARSLRLQRTYTIGVIAEEIGDAYGAMVISGIEEYLRKYNFFFLTVIHRHD
jgi:hypothetical protein